MQYENEPVDDYEAYVEWYYSQVFRELIPAAEPVIPDFMFAEQAA